MGTRTIAPHVVTIEHDSKSHEYDCHEHCTASLSCPGVADHCRCWLECTVCRDAAQGMDAEAMDEYDEALYRDGDAHGEEHQRIDGMWMTPTDRCLSQELDTDASELVGVLAEGDHPVDIQCEEDFVYVTAIRSGRDI